MNSMDRLPFYPESGARTAQGISTPASQPTMGYGLSALPRSIAQPANVPYYVRALALGIPAYLIGVHLWTWVLYLPLFLGGRADFRQLYVGAYMLRSGHARELYDYAAQKHFEDLLVSAAQGALPVNHLAYEEVLFVPFSYLKFKTGYFSFLGVNVVLLFIAYRLIKPWMENLATIYRWLPAAIFLAFLPIAAALLQGQDSILLLVLLAGASALLQRRRDFAAGCLVALGMFKFQIVLPIALLFLLWRRWRFSAGFATSATVVSGLSLMLVGPAQAKLYGRSILSMSVGLSSLADQFKYAISPSAMPNLRGLIFGISNGWLSREWIQVLIVASSCFVLLITVIIGREVRSVMDKMLIAITASTLVSYHLLIHDLAVLLIPIAVILSRYIPAEGAATESGCWIARAATLSFVAPLCISFIPAHFYVVSLALCAFLMALLAGPHNAREPHGYRDMPSFSNGETKV